MTEEININTKALRDEIAAIPREYAKELDSMGWGIRRPDELTAIYNASTNIEGRIRTSPAMTALVESADRLAELEAQIGTLEADLARSRRAHDRAAIADGERIERLEQQLADAQAEAQRYQTLYLNLVRAFDQHAQQWMRDDGDGGLAGTLGRITAELSAWRELHAAATVGSPDLWPNEWPQDVAAVAFVIHQLRAEPARVRGLLAAAHCPSCDGSGTIAHGPTPDGDWELEQCQWCDEKNAALAAGGDM